MEKLAAVRARQGKTTEVVAALQDALIDGRPEAPGKYFQVSRRLETWGMLDQARKFAEDGVAKAAPDLLANGENGDGVKTYVRVMTRLRQHEQAYSVLQKGLEDAKAELPVVKEQVEKKGISGRKYLFHARGASCIRTVCRVETERHEPRRPGQIPDPTGSQCESR
jgi:hypothetical protein